MDTRYFKKPFATDGDRNVVPDVAPVDGSVSYSSGFGPDYQLDPATDPSALDIQRPDHNGILYDVTDSMRALQEFFAPQWITAADNGGAPFAYAAKALVLYTDGQVWQSLVAGNTHEPGTDPTKWIVFQSDQATAAALSAEITRATNAEGDLADALILAAAAIPPPGTVLLFAAAVAPVGWLECAGQSLARTGAYAALFAAIGTVWGAPDGTHFRLPDLRGVFVRGWDDDRGVDVGRAFASFQEDSVQPHTHSFKYSSDNSGDVGPGHGGNQLGLSATEVNAPDTNSETRPRNYALMYIIKI